MTVRVTSPPMIVSAPAPTVSKLFADVMSSRDVAPVPPLPTGRVPVTSAVRSTPPALIVTAPLLTEKLSVENEAIPLLEEVASSPDISIVPSPLVTSIPSPAVIVVFANPLSPPTNISPLMLKDKKIIATKKIYPSESIKKENTNFL